MQLLDMVFSDGYVGPGMEDRLHDLGIAGDFLFVSCGEFLDIEAGEHLLDLAVGQLASLDARGGTNTLNGGDPTQGV